MVANDKRFCDMATFAGCAKKVHTFEAASLDVMQGNGADPINDVEMKASHEKALALFRHIQWQFGWFPDGPMLQDPVLHATRLVKAIRQRLYLQLDKFTIERCGFCCFADMPPMFLGQWASHHEFVTGFCTIAMEQVGSYKVAVNLPAIRESDLGIVTQPQFDAIIALTRQFYGFHPRVAPVTFQCAMVIGTDGASRILKCTKSEANMSNDAVWEKQFKRWLPWGV